MIDAMVRAWRAAVVSAFVPATVLADPPRIEPFTLDLAGWTANVQNDGAHRHVTFTTSGTRCSVAIDRWWGLPPNPGPPLVQQGTRAVTVDGRPMFLVEATVGARHGDVLFVNHGSDFGRIWFSLCTEAEENAVLANVRLAR